MSSSKINHKDVQALFRGFDKRWPQGRFFYCRYESPEGGHALLNFIGPLTSYLNLEEENYPDLAVNVAFTYPGLEMLGLNPGVLASFPRDFSQGMVRRAELNGDIGDNGPENWDPFWRDADNVHIWIGLYARSDKALADWTKDFEEWINNQTMMRGEMFAQRTLPIRIVGRQDVRRFWSDKNIKMHIDDESTNPKRSVVLEHFGFRDGISQPLIEGMETNERKAKQRVPGNGKLSPDGSWAPLATGEFLLGYQDEMGEIPLAPVPPTLARNGSFMVHRKLEQDVDGFRSYFKKKAAMISTQSGVTVTADYLAAKIVGRERSGRPLADTESLNDFRYANDVRGKRCPMGAHMRRSNPRDTMSTDSRVSEEFGSILVNRHRILRRAITYGKPIPNDERPGQTEKPSQEDINPDGQGLMFMALQTNISRQFEFVQQQWVNFGNDLNEGNNRDPLIGNQTGKGRIAIPGDDANPTVICDKLPRFVTTKGGNYFFLPGVRAFSLLAKGRFTEINTEK